MIQKTINKLPKSVVEVSIEVPWLDIETKWNEVVQKAAAEIELPGFRKGSAPLAMVEGQQGVKLQDEALKVVMPEFLIQALQGSDIVPIDYPKYQVVNFAKGQGLQFKALVTNRPTISIGDYKNIHINKPTPKVVSEEEVGKVIEDLFNRWKAKVGSAATPAPSNEPAAGSISFSGQSDTAPAPISVPDDVFAKAMGTNDLNDLKLKIRKDLEDHVNYNSELDYEESILQEVAKVTQVEVPDILVDDELNRMLVSLQRRVADMGLLLEDYLKSQNTTLEELKNKWRTQAEANMRMELGLSEIARLENVQISDIELQAEIDKIQDGKVKQQFESQEPRLHLKHALRQTRTLDLLKKLVAPNIS